MKKAVSMFLVAMMAVGTLAGCSAPPATEEGETQEATTEEAPMEDEASDAKIAWYAATAHPYFDDVEEGVDQFVEQEGVEVRKLYGPDWEQTSQNEKLRALAADGIEYISTYPNSGGASGTYEELISGGVSVVGFGAQTADQGELLCVATDVYQAAYDATQAVIDAMGGEGGIFNVLEVISDPNTIQRQQAVADCIAANPGVELIAEVADISNVDVGREKITSGLAAHEGKINGIICTGNATSDAVASVLSDYYVQNPDAEKIYAIGIDTADTVMNAIKDDVMFATIAQNPKGHAYISLKLLQLMSEGYTKVEGTYFIDAGSCVVTKENIDTYEEEIDMRTEEILEELTTKYVEKK